MGVSYLELPEVRVKYYVFGSGEPRLLVTAGIHGDEVTGVYAAYRLVEYLRSLGTLRGTVVVVPVVNVLGFAARTRFNPVDYVDMNRVFPEGAGSAVTRRIVQAVWEMVESSNYVIDLHCAGLSSYQYVLALYEEFPKVREFTELIPWDTVVESTGLRGQLFVEATHRGIPSAIVETVGGDGYYSEEWGEKLFEVVLGLLREVGIAEVFRQPRAVHRTYYGRLVQVRAPTEGFPRPAVEPGSSVREGDVLCYVGGCPVASPVPGKLIKVSKGTYVFEGDSVASVAPLKRG